ncbi:MAG: nucleotidyltransferase domain-containing protein [Candidatus Bathyarchaeia archaeon]
MSEVVRVKYDEERWRVFHALRGDAAAMVEPLSKRHIECQAYGSIARGDVTEESDIDVFIPNPPAPTIIEAALLRHGMKVSRREIIQATPSYAAKGYIYLDRLRSYSFPLVDLRPVEREFYNFAGSVNGEDLARGTRVPGVDKKLMLIQPTVDGHTESPVRGRESFVAGILEVDVHIVVQRVRTLERRGKVGRTGVYLKREIAPEESFGDVLHRLAASRPALRRRIRK